MAGQKSKVLTVKETCAKVTEALKALGGKGAVTQLKAKGCTYIEIQTALTAKAITRADGGPVHHGSDVQWVYQLAPKNRGG